MLFRAIAASSNLGRSGRLKLKYWCSPEILDHNWEKFSQGDAGTVDAALRKVSAMKLNADFRGLESRYPGTPDLHPGIPDIYPLHDDPSMYLRWTNFFTRLSNIKMLLLQGLTEGYGQLLQSFIESPSLRFPLLESLTIAGCMGWAATPRFNRPHTYSTRDLTAFLLCHRSSLENLKLRDASGHGMGTGLLSLENFTAHLNSIKSDLPYLKSATIVETNWANFKMIAETDPALASRYRPLLPYARDRAIERESELGRFARGLEIEPAEREVQPCKSLTKEEAEARTALQLDRHPALRFTYDFGPFVMRREA